MGAGPKVFGSALAPSSIGSDHKMLKSLADWSVQGFDPGSLDFETM